MASTDNAASSRTHLDRIFEAERNMRTAEQELMSLPPGVVEETLKSAFAEASKLADRQEMTGRMVRLTDLCAQIPSAGMTEMLIKILNDEDTEVRVAAGEALRDVAYDRYAEVARAIERAVTNPGLEIALAELPWIIAEIGEPSAVPLIRRFLAHKDGDVVASAIEAVVMLGDVSALADVEALVNDKRRVIVVDEDAEGDDEATIGALAKEAVRELSVDPD